MRIFFISILLYTITKADDNDTKYIDLLPEKEKQEFLENIARRILDEVQIKDDRPKKSSEIPDEQLNEHDAFIHKIMKEETENLRRQSNNTNKKTIKDNIGRIFTEEKRTKGESYIDLTLRTDKNRTKRESKRRVFTGFSSENNNRSEYNGNESDVDIQVKNFRRSVNNPDETRVPEEADVTTISDKIANDNNKEEIETPIQDQNNEREATTDYNDNKQENVATIQDNLNKDDNISTDKKYSINELIKTTEYINNQQETESTTQDSFQSLRTDEPVSEPVQLDVIQKTYENINYNLSEKKKEIKSNEDAISRVKTTKAPKTTDRVLKSSNNISELNIELNKSQEKESKDSDVINIEIATQQQQIVQVTQGVPLVTEINDNVNKGQNRGNSMLTTTEETKLMTPTTLETTNPSSSKQKHILRNKTFKPTKNKDANEPEKKNKVKSKQMSIASKKFVSDVIKALKLKLMDKTLNDNVYYKAQSEKNKPMEHNVFEISPDVSPFVKQKPRKQSKSIQPDIIQLMSLQSDNKRPKQKPNRNQHKSKPVTMSEQAYHVPIYNYLPNNAFYNPQNVLGPNPDDDVEYVIKNDEGYKFPSFMPKSTNKLNQKDETETDEEPFHVPVYYYSPENAYYNANNYYGPNLQNSNEKQDDNNSEYDDASYDMENNDEKNKERNDIEWQYYNDPHISFKVGKDLTKKKKGEPLEVNLPKSVLDFILKETNIDLQGYIDKNYSNKNKKALRCKYKTKCVKCNSEPKSSEFQTNANDNADDEEVTIMPMVDNMSKIRHMMLEKKHFMHFQPLNTSRYDAYLQEKEVNDDDDPQTQLRSSFPMDYDDLFRKDKSKGQNISIDYYFNKYDEYNSAGNKLNINSQSENYNSDGKRQLENSKYYEYNPLKRIYYKYSNYNKRPRIYVEKYNKTLQKMLDKYKKPEKVLEKNNKNIQQLFKKNYKFIARSRKSSEEHEEIVKYILKDAKGDKKKEYDMIKEVTKYLHDDEIMKMYLKLEQLELHEAKKEAGRSTDVRNELDVYEEVLGDMIKENNKALGQYDWLGTAVDLQSAIQKMLNMAESVQNEKDLHPSDLELLKYILYLHTYSRDEMVPSIHKKALRDMIMPRGKKPSQYLSREPGLNYRAWQVRSSQPKDALDDDLDEYRRFLEDLQTALYDLHTALKYIAMATKYKNQKWFESLKQIHIESKRKQLLEIILHLCTTRLLGMIEESAKKGLEDNFVEYVNKHEKEVVRTRDEFVFVLKLLKEIKRIT